VCVCEREECSKNRNGSYCVAQNILTRDVERLIVLCRPRLNLLPPARADHVVTNLGVRLEHNHVVAEMAFHRERVDWCAVVVSDLLLFRVVPHASADVAVASAAPKVPWCLEADDEDAC
jgi:hypothetical protein